MTDLEDPIIKGISLYGWRGRSQKGLRMSQCYPAFLRIYASAFLTMAYHADRVGNRRGARKDRATAALAQQWADRLFAAIDLRAVG